MSLSSKQILVWGARSHLTVVRPMIDAANYHINLLLDNDKELICPLDVPFIAGTTAVNEWLESAQEQVALPEAFVVAIGGTLGNERLAIARRLQQLNIQPLDLIHHTAWVSPSAQIGKGCHLLPMCAICENAQIGEQVIVNTNASVDHDCIIKDGVHIMPGATLAGCVEVEEGASIGSNATILPRIRIGKGAIVGAGAVVTKNVAAGKVVYGNPGKIQRLVRD